MRANMHTKPFDIEVAMKKNQDLSELEPLELEKTVVNLSKHHFSFYTTEELGMNTG